MNSTLSTLPAQIISIHSPRAGGDQRQNRAYDGLLAISIHSPRAGGDHSFGASCTLSSSFQSTPPVRGETTRPPSPPGSPSDFNPLPPCGGRLAAVVVKAPEGDISIHSPRAGGDSLAVQCRTSLKNFNPLPPCGGRRTFSFLHICSPYFNPLPPCGGRRAGHPADSSAGSISIHSPRAGGDEFIIDKGRVSYLFQSTPPVRGETIWNKGFRYPGRFQSTPPVRGETVPAGCTCN